MTGSPLGLLYSPASRRSWALPPCLAFSQVFILFGMFQVTISLRNQCGWSCSHTWCYSVAALWGTWIQWDCVSFSLQEVEIQILYAIKYHWLYSSLSLLRVSSGDPSSLVSALLWLWGGGMRQSTCLGPIWVWIPWSWQCFGSAARHEGEWAHGRSALLA